MNKQNKENKIKRGCLYWLLFGWLFEITYWIIFGWWVKPLLLLNEKLKEKNEISPQSTQNNFQPKNNSDLTAQIHDVPKLLMVFLLNIIISMKNCAKSGVRNPIFLN